MPLNPETLKAMKEAAAKATGEPLTLIRYDHGGGRLYRESPRDLVADFYDEANREYYNLTHPANVSALIAQRDALAAEVERQAGEIERLKERMYRVNYGLGPQ